MQRLVATGLDSVRRNDDVLPENMAKEDLAILIIGPTGVGKSTFIRNVLLAVNSNLNPSINSALLRFTNRVAQYSVRVPSATNPNRLVVLVDTPSLDHRNMDALESLRQISSWLASLHAVDVRFGIVFMFPIFAGGLTRVDLAIFQIFRKLCGPRHFLRIIGVTTKWDTCPNGRGERREQEIWDEFWKEDDHRDQVIPVHRLRNSLESALAVFRSIFRRCESVSTDRQLPLAIQREIVVEGKTFGNTAAAKLCTSLLINKDKNPRRYSLSRIADVLMFRPATVPISSVVESNPSDDDSANSGLGIMIAIGSSPESRQSGCTCFQGAEGGLLPEPIEELPAPDPIKEVSTPEDLPAPHPIEDFSATDPRFSMTSSYYTVPMTPTQDSPVSDHRLSMASSYYTVPTTPTQGRPIVLELRPPMDSSYSAFADSTTTPTIPEVDDPEDPYVTGNLDTRSSTLFSSSITTLPRQAPPSDTSSSTTLDGASPPPLSGQSDGRERGNHQSHQQFMPGARHFTVGKMDVQNIQAETLIINNFNCCPHHGRSSGPPRHSTM